MSDCSFLWRALNSHSSGVLTALFGCYMPGATRNGCRLGAFIEPCTVSRQFKQCHIRRAHTCLAVICHLHFWQNDRDVLRATAVTCNSIAHLAGNGDVLNVRESAVLVVVGIPPQRSPKCMARWNSNVLMKVNVSSSASDIDSGILKCRLSFC